MSNYERMNSGSSWQAAKKPEGYKVVTDEIVNDRSKGNSQIKEPVNISWLLSQLKNALTENHSENKADFIGNLLSSFQDSKYFKEQFDFPEHNFATVAKLLTTNDSSNIQQGLSLLGIKDEYVQNATTKMLTLFEDMATNARRIKTAVQHAEDNYAYSWKQFIEETQLNGGITAGELKDLVNNVFSGGYSLPHLHVLFHDRSPYPPLECSKEIKEILYGEKRRLELMSLLNNLNLTKAAEQLANKDTAEAINKILGRPEILNRDLLQSLMCLLENQFIISPEASAYVRSESNRHQLIRFFNGLGRNDLTQLLEDVVWLERSTECLSNIQNVDLFFDAEELVDGGLSAQRANEILANWGLAEKVTVAESNVEIKSTKSTEPQTTTIENQDISVGLNIPDNRQDITKLLKGRLDQQKVLAAVQTNANNNSTIGEQITDSQKSEAELTDLLKPIMMFAGDANYFAKGIWKSNQANHLAQLAQQAGAKDWASYFTTIRNYGSYEFTLTLAELDQYKKLFAGELKPIELSDFINGLVNRGMLTADFAASLSQEAERIAAVTNHAVDYQHAVANISGLQNLSEAETKQMYVSGLSDLAKDIMQLKQGLENLQNDLAQQNSNTASYKDPQTLLRDIKALEKFDEQLNSLAQVQANFLDKINAFDHDRKFTASGDLQNLLKMLITQINQLGRNHNLASLTLKCKEQKKRLFGLLEFIEKDRHSNVKLFKNPVLQELIAVMQGASIQLNKISAVNQLSNKAELTPEILLGALSEVVDVLDNKLIEDNFDRINKANRILHDIAKWPDLDTFELVGKDNSNSVKISQDLVSHYKKILSGYKKNLHNLSHKKSLDEQLQLLQQLAKTNTELDQRLFQDSEAINHLYKKIHAQQQSLHSDVELNMVGVEKILADNFTPWNDHRQKLQKQLIQQLAELTTAQNTFKEKADALVEQKQIYMHALVQQIESWPKRFAEQSAKIDGYIAKVDSASVKDKKRHVENVSQLRNDMEMMRDLLLYVKQLEQGHADTLVVDINHVNFLLSVCEENIQKASTYLDKNNLQQQSQSEDWKHAKPALFEHKDFEIHHHDRMKTDGPILREIAINEKETASYQEFTDKVICKDFQQFSRDAKIKILQAMCFNEAMHAASGETIDINWKDNNVSQGERDEMIRSACIMFAALRTDVTITANGEKFDTQANAKEIEKEYQSIKKTFEKRGGLKGVNDEIIGKVVSEDTSLKEVTAFSNDMRR